MPVLAVVSVFVIYVIFSYDNFPYPGSCRYSEDETDRSAHSGSAEVVMKTEEGTQLGWRQRPSEVQAVSKHHPSGVLDLHPS